MQNGFETGVALLDRFSSVSSGGDSAIADVFLATSVYSKRCQLGLARLLTI